MSKHRTKQGEHGTLYRYAIDYDDGPGTDGGTWYCWAYCADHAADRFDDDHGGWRMASSPRRVKQ